MPLTHPTSDQELLAAYLAGSPEAFGQLVTRYIDMVHAAATRQAPDHADDITQAVFILLSQKAAKVRDPAALAGWLFTTTRLCANHARRAAQRRRIHEREAVMQTSSDPSGYAALIPLLDAGLAALSAAERELILQHHLQSRGLADLAAQLQISLPAVTKRTQRALEKLRHWFTRHGNELPSPALISILASQSAHRAPASLFNASPTFSATTLAKSVSVRLATTTLKAAAAVTLIVLAAGVAGIAMFPLTSGKPPMPVASTGVLPTPSITKNYSIPPAVTQLESQIFLARAAIASGRFVVEHVYEDIATGRSTRARVEDVIDEANFTEHRYVNGKLQIYCSTPDAVYEYDNTSSDASPLRIFPRGVQPDRMFIHDPLKLMFQPMDYYGSIGSPRDRYIGSPDRHSILAVETEWEGLRAVRVSFQRDWGNGRESPMSYIAIPSRSFSVVEMTGGPGGVDQERQFSVKCTLKEIAKEMWFPDHVTHTETHGGVLAIREELTMQVEGVNEAIDPALFTLKELGIPVGVRVVQVPLRPATQPASNAIKFDGEKIVPMTSQDIDRLLKR